MRTALAFLQTGADTVACVTSPAGPVASPRTGLPAVFAPPFSLAPDVPPWFEAGGESLAVLSPDEWRRQFPGPSRPIRLPAWGAPDEARFADAFRGLASRLADGSLRKGVPITRMSAAVAPDDAETLAARLLARVPDLPGSLFAYGLYRPASATGTGAPEFVVGATPELLFEVDADGRLSTMAVAGTRRADAESASLASSVKDRDEQAAVVEDLVTQLSAWGRPEVAGTIVRSFGTLAHLTTDIRVDAGGALDFEEVARRLHPTPALGVYPRGEAGSAWLAGIDPDGERGRFGAPFGLRWPSGAGRCVVAIRNLQYRAGRLDIWAGCGVVSQSRYEDEWQEVLDKMQAVRALWGV